MVISSSCAHGLALPAILCPGALADAGVGAREIRLCDLQVEHGLTFGLVLGFDDLPGFIFIAGLQAGAFAGLRVQAIKGPSPIAATKQAVTCFHTVFHATAKIKEASPEVLAHRRWLITACAGYYGLPDLVSVLVSVADPLTPKLLLHSQLRMEPMAGIEPATDGLRNRCSTAELHWLNYYELNQYLFWFSMICIVSLYDMVRLWTERKPYAVCV